MSRKILVPWAMPEIGREVLRKSKAEIIFLHGPKGELPTPKEIMKGIFECRYSSSKCISTCPERDDHGKSQSSAELPISVWGIITSM